MYSDLKYGIHFLMGPTYYSALLLFLVKLAFKLLRKGFKRLVQCDLVLLVTEKDCKILDKYLLHKK